MSAPEVKQIRTRRQHQSKTMQVKQAKLLKQYHLVPETPHHYNKRHSLDCGISKCPLCQNPRRTHKDTLTIQERRFYQEYADDDAPTGRDSTHIS